MLTCLACSKQPNGGSIFEPPEEGENVSTPPSKQSIKVLTSQIKDMAIKASGAYKSCKSCSGSTRHLKNHAYSDVGSVSERFYGSYRRNCSSYSTPRPLGKDTEAKLKVLSSGSCTPASASASASASVSGRAESVVFMEEDEPKEWVAQVEPGVLITFVSLPQGGNDLKRIRFSREMFNKLQAQQWWEENYDKVMELYNVQRFNRQGMPVPTPPRYEDENAMGASAEDSPVTPPLRKECLPRNFRRPAGTGWHDKHPMQSQNDCDAEILNSTPKLSSISAAKTESSSVDASARSSYSREVLSDSSASDLEREWVEQDDPGVYITIRVLLSGERELKRVRFSRERFGEVQARLWWEENRARIQRQYL